jgi:uncharacterized protein YceH (UPF0502 family)
VTVQLQDLQRSFLRHLRAEGRSPNTLRRYGQAVTFFSRWLEVQGREATFDELNRAAIRKWPAVLSDTHEPGTVKTRYRGLFTEEVGVRKAARHAQKAAEGRWLKRTDEGNGKLAELRAAGGRGIVTCRDAS